MMDLTSSDIWIFIIGSLCAVAAALLGSFLVLREMSLLGDAISHAVLPGLAAAFLISGSRSSVIMFIGAAVVGVFTAVATEWIRNLGKVDEGASMGVVFTGLFALGLLMVVQAADHVDLDAGCVLYGAIELTPWDTWQVGPWQIPRVAIILGCVAAINAVFVIAFFKELRITSFDPALATALGINARIMHYLLMTLVAVTAVASFESVGNILVVAMFIVPPATAYLITDRLSTMVLLSCAIGVVSVAIGQYGAWGVPRLFGFPDTSIAGGMATACGFLFGTALLFAPKYGIVSRAVRRSWLNWRIVREDVLGYLYRAEERDSRVRTDIPPLAENILASPWLVSIAIRHLKRQQKLAETTGNWYLTDTGRAEARHLLRSHRLWENYLVKQGDIATDRIHPTAERLEHITDSKLRKRLADETDSTFIDPHGRPIPPEEE